MPKASAGIMLFRRRGGSLEVLLVHPGGPFWARKDRAGWSIPKGEILPGEEPIEAARREFLEETGSPAKGDLLPLGAVKYAGGKKVFVWALEGDLDAAGIRCNAFSIEWPPRSGTMKEFPEVDRAEWFDLPAAADKLHAGLVPLLGTLQKMVGG